MYTLSNSSDTCGHQPFKGRQQQQEYQQQRGLHLCSEVTPAIAGMPANDNRKDDCKNSKDDEVKREMTPTGSPPTAETLAIDGTKVGTQATAGTPSTAGGASN
jgi:hypothetical protein